MIIEREPDGVGIRVQVRVGQYAQEVTKVLWDKLVARTYSNDKLCPVCQEIMHGGELFKDTGFMTDNSRTVANRLRNCSRVFCDNCPACIVRFQNENKNRYFQTGMMGLK